jgi:hypothetical protein
MGVDERVDRHLLSAFYRPRPPPWISQSVRPSSRGQTSLGSRSGDAHRRFPPRLRRRRFRGGVAKNKQEVGRRLALEALRVAYDRRIVSYGPLFGECKRKGQRMVIRLDVVGGGLKTTDGQPPCGFAIAGRSRQRV